ncbi:MAG TPA: hypothetical protein VGO03_13655 [Acidimicrobiia bacterium]
MTCAFGDTVAAAAFRLEKRLIGARDDIVEFVVTNGAAHAERDRERWHCAGVECEREAFADAFAHCDGVIVAAMRQDDDEFLAAVAGDQIVWADGVTQHSGEEAERSVAGGVPMHVIELLEVVEVGVGDCERGVGRAQLAYLILQAAAVEQTCERVRARSHFRFVERAHHSDTLRCAPRDELEIPVLTLGRRLIGGCRRVHHAKRATGDPERHARGGARTGGTVLEVRAGIEELAGTERHRLAADRRWAVERRSHIATAQCISGVVRCLERSREVRVARVSDKDIDVQARDAFAGGVVHHAPHRRLGMGHVERNLQAQLEFATGFGRPAHEIFVMHTGSGDKRGSDQRDDDNAIEYQDGKNGEIRIRNCVVRRR